jgi:hypothetical protein
MEDEVQETYQAYSKIVEQIIKEDTLVNHRMTWGVSVNGGLITLVIATFGLLKDEIKTGDRLYILILSFIIMLLASVGAWISYQTYNGILDARKQIYYIRDIYKKKGKRKLRKISACPDLLAVGPFLLMLMGSQRKCQHGGVTIWCEGSGFSG